MNRCISKYPAVIMFFFILAATSASAKIVPEDLIHIAGFDDQINVPAGLTTDEPGHVRHPDAKPQVILHYDQSGNYKDRFGLSQVPISLAITQNHSLVVGLKDGSLIKIDPNGSQSVLCTGCSYPAAMDIDPFGNIHIADSQAACVRVIDQFRVPVNTLGAGTLIYPVGIA